MFFLKTQADSYAKNTTESAYHYWRMRIFTALYGGYIVFYLTRKSFTFCIPNIIEDLAYTKADLGILASILYISYGISKLISGVMSDRISSRYFMSLGLCLTGVCNLLFANSSSLLIFAIFWGANGFFQGWGLPPCTKQITYWFNSRERGRWWSIQSTANNVGGSLSPIIMATLISLLTWRQAMTIIGLIGIFISLILLLRLRDSPESLGLPPVEDPTEPTNQVEAANKDTFTTIKYILSNKNLWLLAWSFFMIFAIRTAINDWAVLYLTQTQDYSLLAATSSVTWFEIGGFFGCLIAGWASDSYFYGQRIPVIVISTIGLIISLIAFFYNPWNYKFIDQICLAFIGVFIFGPQMLVGLSSAEFVDKKMACSASGFTGGFAYLGAAITGYPMGKLIDLYSWDLFFLCLITCCTILIFLNLPLLLQQKPLDRKTVKI